MRDLRSEQFADALDRRERVFDDVVEHARGNGDHIQLHVREEVGDRQRVDQVGLARMAHLSLVLERREHVGAAEQFDVSVRAVGPDFFEQILEANHGTWCLTTLSGDGLSYDRHTRRAFLRKVPENRPKNDNS